MADETPQADFGSLVTNQNLIDFIPGLSSPLPDALGIVVRAVEVAVQGYCQRQFLSTKYEDEQYVINAMPRQFDGIAVSPQLKFSLRQTPVSELTAIKQVTEHKADGSVTSSPLDVNSYYLKKPGIVVFFSLNQFRFQQQFLSRFPADMSGYMPLEIPVELLVSYTGGYETMPDDALLGLLMAVSRLWKLRELQMFHVDSIQGDMVATTLSRVDLTAEEKSMLNSYRVWSLA